MEETNIEIQKRKENFIKFLKENKNKLSYVLLGIITLFGCYIRTLNLNLLKDVTTGKYIPGPEADTFVFLRYAQDILQHGSLMAQDMMRYYPLGLDTSKEALGLSYVLVYLYKFLHLFNSNITLEYIAVIYPVIFFAIGMIFFFLLVKKLFDHKIALLSCTFLAIIPGYLYRTMAGWADKEPLGMALMFATLYFFISSLQNKNIKLSIFFSILAGFFVGLMTASWGGVTSIYLIIGGFVFVCAFFDILNKKQFLVISVFIVSLLTFSHIFTERFIIPRFLTGIASFPLILGYFILLLNIFIFEKDVFKLKQKLNIFPHSILSLIIILVLGGIYYIILFGLTFLKNIFNQIYVYLLIPFGTNRWALTVAESHQPYLLDWINQLGGGLKFSFIDLGLLFLLFFIFGSILLFYNLIRGIKDSKYLIWVYVAFIFSFIFSRYSQSSILNGENNISLFLYLGSFIIFSLFILHFYIKLYFKDKINFEEIKKSLSSNLNNIFIFSWFFFMALSARGALRLIFLFIPIAIILSSYLIVSIFNYIKKQKKYNNPWIIISLGLILFFIIFSLSSAVLYQSKNIGPSYNQQWQVAMSWVRENTPKNSVFAHWWDYGYLVQTGGERATITDGGNFIYAWNYFMGRNVLTAHSEDEALEFLKSHDANYLLIISDEIGKYPAFSSIGSDENYDRYSWINTFTLDQNNIQETRNQTMLPYVGGTLLDHDFIYNEILFPKQIAGIAGFFIPTKINNETIEFSQPIAILINNNQQYQVPVECIYFNGELHKFKEKGLDGCLRIIPVFDGNQVNNIGALLYVSPEVSKTLFAKLYLFEEKSDNFEEVYNDESNMPLSIYPGAGLIGPLKIWKINYPDNIKKNDTYIGYDLPDPKVMEI